MMAALAEQFWRFCAFLSQLFPVVVQFKTLYLGQYFVLLDEEKNCVVTLDEFVAGRNALGLEKAERVAKAVFAEM